MNDDKEACFGSCVEHGSNRWPPMAVTADKGCRNADGAKAALIAKESDSCFDKAGSL